MQKTTMSDNAPNTGTFASVGSHWQPARKGLSALSWKTRGKIAVSIGMDAIDLASAAAPGAGHFYELFMIPVCCAMWGKRGVWAALEIIEATNLIDGFVPTCSLIACYCARRELASA
jgi:hypothetical protein